MAKEYIERKAAIMTAMNYDGNGNAQDASQDIAAALGCIPAADVRPVMRGRWIRNATSNLHMNCSNCGKVFSNVFQPLLFNFCPNCGADMREALNEP